MSYTINNTNGNLLLTIADGTSANIAGLTLVGQFFVNYGEILQENLVKVVENFARPLAPTNPLPGQLWYNTAENQLKLFTSNTVSVGIATSTTSSTQPTDPSIGSYWFDSQADQLKIYDGAGWLVIGPNYDKELGESGVFPAQLADTDLINHTVIEFKSNTTVKAIFSSDPDFTVNTPISGFPIRIKKGFNLSDDVNDGTVNYHGVSNDSYYFRGLGPEGYFQTGQNNQTIGNLYVKNNSGVWIGENADLKLGVSSAQNRVSIESTVDGASLYISGQYNGSPVPFIEGDITTGQILLATAPTNDRGAATKNYVDTSIGASAHTLNGRINDTLTEINSVRNDVVALGDSKASVANPVFTGAPKATTPVASDRSDRLATTQFVADYLENSLSGFDSIKAGTIMEWASPTLPDSNWQFCEGQAVSRTQYAVLFARIGTAYGEGDGSTTFNLPDFRNRMPIGAGQTYALGTRGGSANLVVPAHTHATSATSTFVGTALPAHTHAFTGNSLPVHSHNFDGTALPAHHHTVSDPGHTHVPRPHTGDYWAGGSSNYVIGYPPGFNFQAGSRSPDGSIDGSRAVTGYDLTLGAAVLQTSTTGVNIALQSAGTPSGTISSTSAGSVDGINSSTSAGIPSGTVTTSVTLSTTGVTGTNQNLPPYLAVRFIIKLNDGRTAESANVIVIASNSNSNVTIINGNVSTVAGRSGDVTLSVADILNAAPVSNPTFTGTVTAPNVASNTNSDVVATTAFVQLQKNSPAFTGAPTAPTAIFSANTNQLATTQFVQLQKVSPALTGTPTAPNAAPGTNTTQIATTAFVNATLATGLDKNTGSNGYQILPGGLILQWGTVTWTSAANVNEATVLDFPMEFNQVLSFTITPRQDTAYPSLIRTLGYSGITNSGATLRKTLESTVAGVVSHGATWMAIGY